MKSSVGFVAVLVLLISYSAFSQERDAALASADTNVVTFRVSMARAIQAGAFSPDDTLLVRYDYVPVAEPPYRERWLSRLGIGSVYTGMESLFVPIGTTVYYRYYIIKYGSYVSERVYCPYVGSCDRQIGPLDRSFTIWDTSDCMTCARRMPYFMSTRPLTRDVRVRWEVDVRPAWYQVAAGDTLRDWASMFNIRHLDSVMNSGVYINGTPTGDWQPWGIQLRDDTTRRMYDDGTHGDRVVKDSIFTRTILASPDSLGIGTKGQVGQIFKFSIGGGDNESGFGANHEANINDSEPEYTIAEQWGSNDPIFYRCWDYGNHRPWPCFTGVGDVPFRPVRFELCQSYPNPFNPNTTVRFGLPERALITLTLYNILGQLVAILAQGVHEPGYHEVQVFSTKMSSGVYLYRLQAHQIDGGRAGEFVETRKLIVLR